MESQKAINMFKYYKFEEEALRCNIGPTFHKKIMLDACAMPSSDG